MEGDKDDLYQIVSHISNRSPPLAGLRNCGGRCKPRLTTRLFAHHSLRWDWLSLILILLVYEPQAQASLGDRSRGVKHLL